METAGEGEGKCVGLLVSAELSLACSACLQKIFFGCCWQRQRQTREMQASGGKSEGKNVAPNKPYRPRQAHGHTAMRVCQAVCMRHATA
jgi:hypothetical protein